MSSYSKCQFCGSVEYTFFYAPRICGMCGISYDAGQEEAKERILKLLEEHTPYFTENVATECNGCDWQWNYLDDSCHQDHLSALIKGED